MDDDDEDIDFSAIDKVIEDHQAKRQGSQAAPVSPFGKGAASSAPSVGTAPAPVQQTAVPLQQRQHQQSRHQQPQQQQQQPQGVAAGPNHDQYRSQPLHTSAHQHPPMHQTSQQPQLGSHQHRLGQYAARQPPPSQQSVYTGPKPAGAHQSGAPVGRVSQAAAAALGQQQQKQQHLQWQHSQAQQPGNNTGGHQQQSNREEQLQVEKEALQNQLSMEQGRNTLLKSNLDRKERERDELQRRVQQLSSQSSGLASVTIAEAQKEVATLTQQLAFKEQDVQDLKRRCAEKDQSLRPLEEQVQRLQEERESIQQELEEANRDRRERGAGASTSFDPPPALPCLNSPSPSKTRKLASGAKSSKSTTGVKRKLASVLGSPMGTSRSTPTGGPVQNGHAHLPLQSVPNGHVSNRDDQSVPAAPARQSGVAQSNDPVTAEPLPPAPQLPAYELPTWSTHPPPISHTSTTLQQLWLKCPDSFSRLLSPQHSQSHSSQTPTKAFTPSGSCESKDSSSLALTQLTGQLQRHVQMLACGSASTSVTMLKDLTTFLSTCYAHANVGRDSSASVTATQPTGGQSMGHQVTGHDSSAAMSATGTSAGYYGVTQSALHVLTVLIAHDVACQQTMVDSFAPSKPETQAEEQSKEADIASLHLGGLHLSTRLSITFGTDPGLSKPVMPPRAHASRITRNDKQPGKVLLQVVMQLLLAGNNTAGVRCSLKCLTVMVAVTPVHNRGAFAAVITSGVLDQLLSQPQHAQQALQLLHLLAQSIPICQVLHAGLDEGFQPESGHETAPSQAHLPHQQPVGQPPGHSASSPMDIDAEADTDMARPARWTGSAELLDTLLASLQVPSSPEASPNDPPPPPADPPHPLTTTSQPAPTPATSLSSDTAAPTKPVQHSIQWGVHKTHRLAMLVIATLMQHQQYGLLLHLIQTGEGAKDGGLCQCLLELVDSVTRGDPDTLLAAFTLPLNPGAPPFMTPRLLPSDPPGSGSASALAGRAAAPARHAHGQTSNAALKVTSADITMDAHLWQENVRLSQEALTLLRGILVDDVLGRAGIQDLVSSSSAIRLSLITTTRLAHWPHSDTCTNLHSAAAPLPLQQWVTAWGSSTSSSTKIINGHEDCRGGLICSSVDDVAYMAKSLRQRVLVQLGS